MKAVLGVVFTEKIQPENEMSGITYEMLIKYTCDLPVPQLTYLTGAT